MIFYSKKMSLPRKFLCFYIVVLAEIYSYLYIIFPNKKIASKRKLKKFIHDNDIKDGIFIL